MIYESSGKRESSMEEITFVFPSGGYIVVNLSKEDASNLLELVKQYGIPLEIRLSDLVKTSL